MSNCLFEAAFENILERCKCAPGFHMMGGDEAMEKYEICMGANLTCMNDLMNRMGAGEVLSSYKCHNLYLFQASLTMWTMKGSRPNAALLVRTR